MAVRFADLERPQHLGIDPLTLPSKPGLNLPKNLATQVLLHRLVRGSQQRENIIGGGLLLHPRAHVEQFSREVNRGKYLDYGRRAAEGLRVKVYNETQYGKNHEDARKGEGTKSHGIAHEGRLWDWDESFLMVKEFGLEAKQLYLVPALWNAGHDGDQLDGEHKKLAKPKHGHDFAGALQTLVFANRYQHEAVLAADDARLVTGITAGLMLYHDEPTTQQKLLDATEKVDGPKAYEVTPNGVRRYYSAAELLKRFEDDKQEGIDLFSLQDWQIADLTQLKKSKVAGLVNQETTPFGLDTTFEADFRQELHAIASVQRQPDGSVILTPEEADKRALVPEKILGRISQTQAARLRQDAMLLGDILRLADQLDMVAPPDLAMTRKWEVPISKERPLYRQYTRDGRTTLDRILKGKSKEDPEDDSDFGRGLWETYNMIQQIQPRDGQLRPSLDSSTYISELVYKLHGDNISLHQEVFPLLMKGGRTQIPSEKASRSRIEQRIEQIFETDLVNMSNKLLRQAGLERRRKVRRYQDPKVYSENVQAYLKQHNKYEQAQTLSQLEHALARAALKTMTNLDEKNNLVGLVPYPQEAIGDVQAICQQLHTQLKDLYQQTYNRKLSHHDLRVPFASYHSTVQEPTPAGVRTVRPYTIVA